MSHSLSRYSRTTAPSTLPNRLRCDRCLTVKGTTFFSARQRDQAAERLATNPRLDPSLRAIATCLACSPTQVSELECQGCDRWLPLDRFSGAMRRDPDHAFCWTCSTERQNLEPASEDPEVEGGFRPAGDFSSDEDGSDEDEDDDGDDDGRLTAGFGTGGTTISGFGSSSMSMSASTGGVRLSSQASRASTVEPSSGGWAKVRAGARPAVPPPSSRAQAPVGRAGGRGLDDVAVEDSEDSDDSDDD